MPSELLAHLRQILGRHLKENPLLERTLKREFLTRLPTYARDPLILMGNADFDKMVNKQTLWLPIENDETFVVRHSIPVFQLLIFLPAIPKVILAIMFQL